MKVLVLGGNGFIGRHVAQALLHAGHVVVIGTRRPRAPATLSRGWLRPLPKLGVAFHRMTSATTWAPALEDIDVVVNCVGILRERWRETYESVHHHALGALAAACASKGTRLVHVSALALDAPATSGFITSKRNGERALLGRPMDAIIVRPSLLDGQGGFGARWLRALAQLPVHVLPDCAAGRMAPLDVRDLAEAITILCAQPALREVRSVELGGPDVRTMAGHLVALRSPAATPAWQVTLPDALARALSHVCDVLHVSPFSLGHLELMRRDNLPANNALQGLLGRAPRRVCHAGHAASAPWTPETGRATSASTVGRQTAHH
jgi:NADH dehydrogenase